MRLPGFLNWTVGGPAVRALGGSLLAVRATGARYARWRGPWVREGNERRVRAHRISLADWRRQDAELRWLVTAATATRPVRYGDWSGWLPLGRDEVVYWAAGDAGLVEAPYAPRLRSPHFREFSRADAPAAGPPVDTGQVAVTDERVVFVGRTRQEWTYSTLIGMAHTEAGQTWLLVTGRTEVSGVAPAPPLAAEFRLHLALALADRAGQRDAFVAELAEQLQRHQDAKPRPPAPVVAGGAPSSARWGRRRRLLTAAGSAAVLSLSTIGIVMAGNDQRAESLSGSADSPVASSPAPAATPADPAPRAEATGPSRDEPFRQAVPQRQQPAPPPPPQPSPSPSPSTASPSPSPSADTIDPWFRSCDEANENGYGPYVRDQDPEYHWYRDRNGDGVVCQP